MAPDQAISLTQQQTEILEQFRRQSLSRFLRARKFNLNEAKKMIANAQHWRKTVGGVGIDEMYKRLDLFDYPGRDQVFKSWSMYFHKTDKLGRPLNIEFFGGCNLPELYKHITPEKHWEAIVVTTDALTREVLPAVSRAAGRHIDGAFAIVDLKGFGLSQFWQVKSLVRDAFQVSQDYYPETMAKLAIVNAPSSFAFIWSFIKPWLAQETADKIDVLGPDYQQVLLEFIDAENLPTALGGKCVCEHAGGCELSGAGPWMDERLARQAAIREVTNGDANQVITKQSPPLPETLSGVPEQSEGDEPFDELAKDVDGSAHLDSEVHPRV
ncbi:hypothetical protein ID866_5007 [Astraeus odoratus]|nr:hypothetical protein ID866_5007 [Astraeus odoratus]